MDNYKEPADKKEYIEDNIFLICQQLVLETKKNIKPEKNGLIPEDYIPPFNVCEILVETELNVVLSTYLDLCRCNQCRCDIIALALRDLPARYITDTRDEDAIIRIACEYMERTMIAVFKAVKQVNKNPRRTCKKVVPVFWKTRENLDWVN